MNHFLLNLIKKSKSLSYLYKGLELFYDFSFNCWSYLVDLGLESFFKVFIQGKFFFRLVGYMTDIIAFESAFSDFERGVYFLEQ
jgi:hypothetical protein